MLGIDTNVLVRLVVWDDAEQAEAARGLIASRPDGAPVYVSLIVLVETSWVLMARFKRSPEDVLTLMRLLLQSDDFIIEARDAVEAAVTACEHGGDFPDALIAQCNNRAGCRATVTFDHRAAKLPGMAKLETFS